MTKQWQTVLVSMTLHVAALFFLVVLPLLAMDGLPDIPSLTTYVPVEIKTPPTPDAPRSSAPAAQLAPQSSVPVEAPSDVKPEPSERPMISSVAPVDGALGIPGFSTGASVDAVKVPPPPVPKTVSAEPVRPGGLVKTPTRTLYVAPLYPAVAVAARVSGTVIVEAVIGADGAVRDAHVLRSIALLNDAALAAVRQWHYSPTTLNGIPIAVVMTVSVTFTLGG